MARETKIVQCYPSDEAIARTIKEWESFGWEMINNQRFSDRSEATIPFTGGKEITTTTYNKLTFSREKSEKWYKAVREKEEEYESLEMSEKRLWSGGPGDPEFSYAMFLLILIPPFGLWFGVHYFAKKGRYKRAQKKYDLSIRDDIKKLEAAKKVLRDEAAEIIENAQ